MLEALALQIWAVLTANIRTFVPVQSQPTHAVENRVQRLLGGALHVGVFDAARRVLEEPSGGGKRVARGVGLGGLRGVGVRRELLEGLIGDFDGRVFGGAGDSVMAEFPSPVQAVRFAIRFQEEIDEQNAELPEPRRSISYCVARRLSGQVRPRLGALRHRLSSSY